MANKKADEAVATDSVSTEEIEATPEDPAIAHHLHEMRKAAAEAGKSQRKVLSAWEIDGVAGERALVVSPDGKYKVEEK